MGAPKTWHKAFRELPAAWRVLPYFKRSIMQDLWRLSAHDCTGTFPVAGDPAQFLVRALDVVDRHERAKAVKAVRELIEAGLITVDGAVATIRTEPIQHRTDTNPAPQQGLLRYPVGSGTQANDTESLNSGPVDREKEREMSSCVRAPARETKTLDVPLRPPVQTPTRSPGAVASDRINQLTTRSFSSVTRAHREQLHELGLKPDAEWARAAAVLRVAAQKPGGIADMLTPEHILANWHWYSQGKEPPTAASIAAERAQRKPLVAGAAGGRTYREL